MSGKQQDCFGRLVVSAEMHALEGLQEGNKTRKVRLAVGFELQPLQTQSQVPVDRSNAAFLRQSHSFRFVVGQGERDEVPLLLAEQLVVAANAFFSLLRAVLWSGGLRDVVLELRLPQSGTRREAAETGASSRASRTLVSSSRA